MKQIDLLDVPNGEERGETDVFAGYVYHRRQADSVKLAGIGLVCNVWADSISHLPPSFDFFFRHLQALPYPRRCTHESREQHSGGSEAKAVFVSQTLYAVF